MSTTVDQLSIQLTADIKGLQASIDTALASIKGFSKQTQAEGSAMERAIGSAQKALLTFGGAWAAFRVGKDIVDAGVQMQSLQNRMAAATGDIHVAADAMAYARAEAERLGLNLQTTIGGFASFSASALRSGLTLQQTKDIFTSVAEAATALHLSTENTQSAFLALEQMASKGTVQMQELKLQLSQAIPGAFEIMAKSMGVTTQKLNDMMQKGQLLSSVALPALGDELHRQFGERAVVSADSAQASFNRLGNALFELQTKLAQGGLLDSVVRSVKDLTVAINDPSIQSGLADIAKAVSTITEVLVVGIATWADWIAKAYEASKAWMANEMAGGDDVDNRPKGTMSAGRMAKSVPFADPNYTLNPNGNNNSEVSEAAKRAAEKRAQMRTRVGEMTSGLISESDPNKVDSARALAELDKQYQSEQDLLDKALKLKAITTQQFNEDSLKTELDYQSRLAALRKQYRDDFLSDEQAAAEGFLGIKIDEHDKTLHEEGESFRDSISQAAQYNKTFFELEKAAAIAKALIAARQSVVDAYAFGTALGGPALGAVFAGVAAAAQAANIAALVSTSFSGGGGDATGSGGSASGAGDGSATSSAPAATAAPQPKVVNLTIQGSNFGPQQMRDFATSLSEFIGDGTIKLNMASAT